MAKLDSMRGKFFRKVYNVIRFKNKIDDDEQEEDQLKLMEINYVKPGTG